MYTVANVGWSKRTAAINLQLPTIFEGSYRQAKARTACISGPTQLGVSLLHLQPQGLFQKIEKPKQRGAGWRMPRSMPRRKEGEAVKN